jgi:hypothetical protein
MTAVTSPEWNCLSMAASHRSRLNSGRKWHQQLLATRTTNEENQHRHAGGGFAGLSAAMYLDKTLARRIEAEVTLISRKNFVLFAPMLPRTCLGRSRTRDWRST